ncbi:hypothetical protein [Halarsenatibacter silvermanii]|nr:hypothetical protein [Halarsenatibacter silvermanii]
MSSELMHISRKAVDTYLVLDFPSYAVPGAFFRLGELITVEIKRE